VTANLNPDVVAPASGDDGERLAAAEFWMHELVLNGAVLIERMPRSLRQQLSDHAVHGVERQWT
jgi:hypothetical protein